MDEKKLDEKISHLLDDAQTPVTADWEPRVLAALAASPVSRKPSRRLVFGFAGGAALLAILLLLVLISRPADRATKPMAATPGKDRDEAVVRGPAPTPDEKQLAADPKELKRKIARDVVAPAPTGELFAVIAARGEVSDGSGLELKVGDRISAGTTVRTGKGGGLSLVTLQGSEFALDAGSELSVAKNGKSAFLKRGRLYCRNRKHEFGAITTGAGKIELLGTVINARVKNASQVAVTVVEGKVKLANTHGEIVVEAGRQVMFSDGDAPEAGETINPREAIAWYDGRGGVVSDYGDIVYTARGEEDPLTEVWAMGEDGGDKHRVKTYLGAVWLTGPWLAWEPTLLISPNGLCWKYPDLAAGRGDGWEGVSLLGLSPSWWLLNTETGQDSRLELPEDCEPAEPIYPSPEGTMLAFWAARKEEPLEGGNCSRGVYLYDLWTGRLSRLIKAVGYGEIAWSPEGDRLAAEVFVSPERFEQLAVIDINTGASTDFGFQVRDPVFSPEGERMAFIGDFSPGSSRRQGRVFVIDLQPGSQPRPVSPRGEGAQYPQWSPGGDRLLYWVWRNPEGGGMTETSVQVIGSDGSEGKEIYHGVVKASAWATDGEAVYISTQEGILLVAADGSGVIADLGGSSQDRGLAARERRELKRAIAAVREAMLQYALGQWRDYEGRREESRAAYRQAASIFAGLPYRFPRLQFSVSNVLLYADAADALAARPAAEVSEEVCRVHLTHLGALIGHYQEQHNNQAPANLEELAEWAKEKDNIALDGWLIPGKADLESMFRCPEGEAYVYEPSGFGAELEGGELLSCPLHPENILRWQDDGATRRPMGLTYYTERAW